MSAAKHENTQMPLPMTDGALRRSYILHSGGIDSSTALVKALEDDVDDDVISVGVYYGQRHSKEVEYANELCSFLNVSRLVVDMTSPPKSMLTDARAKVPHISYAEIEGMSPTYVPFRNGQLLSRVAGIAQAWVMEQDELEESRPRQATIWFGAHAEDALNWAYPDCTPEFVGAMANAIFVGTYHRVRVIAPFMHSTKDEIIRVGERLSVPWRLTWSCYKGEEKHCGQCPTCFARKAAFTKAGVLDPTLYAV
jgi:7-cyano-7-deazaguanine synthase